MILVPPPNEWVGPAGRAIPELARALGRTLKVSPGMARPILALRLARSEDGDPILREIARVTLGEWKPAPDGTLTLVQNPTARNRARIAIDKADALAWANTVRRRRASLDPHPDWRKLSREALGLRKAYDASDDPRPVWRFTGKTPEGRLWNRLAIQLPLFELSRIPVGAYSDRGGSVVRSLPPGALAAIRTFLAEWSAWHDVRRTGPPIDNPPILDERILGDKDAPVNVDRIALRWTSRPDRVDFYLKLYDRGGDTVQTFEHAMGRDEALDEDPRLPERETVPYPPLAAAQIQEHSFVTFVERPGPALVEAALDVVRNDPVFPATLPLLTEARRRDRSLVSLFPDEGVEEDDDRYDHPTPSEWMARGLTERDGVLTMAPPDPLRSERETAPRGLLDTAVRLARRPTAWVAERSESVWSLRAFPDGSIGAKLPRVVAEKAGNGDLGDNRRWWLVHGGLTKAQRRRAETGGLPLSALGPESREVLRKIVYGPFETALSEDQITDARSDPALRWPDGWRSGTLRLERRDDRYLAVFADGRWDRLTGEHYFLFKEILRDPKSFGAPTNLPKVDMNDVIPILREAVVVSLEIEDLRWQSSLSSDAKVGPRTSVDRLTGEWKTWFAIQETAAQRAIGEFRANQPPP